MENFSPLKPVPLRKGKNYAPTKPLIALRDKDKNNTSHYLTDALRERYRHYMAEQKETRESLIAAGQQTALFIQGEQDLRWNPFTKNFYTVPLNQRKNSKKKVTPIMRFYASNGEARYLSSNPDITVTAAREDDRCVQAAKGANTIIDYCERNLYTNWFNRVEALNLMSWGTQINRVQWDSQIDGFKAVQEIFADKEFPISKGVGQCYDCGRSGTGEDFLSKDSVIPQCPDCDSNNAYAEPPATQIIPVKTGEKTINLGNFRLQQLEFPACVWDLKYKAEESSRFIYEQMTYLGAIQRIIGDVEIPEEKLGDSFGLEVIESLSTAGQPIGGRTSVSNIATRLYKERVKVTEMYLSPEDMAGIKIKGDENTINGGKLPIDANLADLFPDGLVAVGLNGMQLLLGVYSGSHKNELTTGTWFQRSFSGAGQGMSDTVQLQDRFNDNDSQAWLAAQMNATPATLYAEGTIAPEYVQALGKPDVAIPINLDQFPNLRSISELIAQPRIGQIDSQLLNYQAQNLQNMMSLTTQVTSFSGGLPGVNNKTATGANIGEANSASLFTPMLSIKVDTRIRQGKIFVELYRDNVPVAQYFPISSKYGAQQGVWLSGADLDKDLQYTCVKNSELPKNQYTIRDDIDRFFMTVGGGQGLLMLIEAKPQFADEVIKKYGIDFEIDHFDDTAQVCRQRFENGKKLLGQFLKVQQMVQDAIAQMPQMSQQMPQAQPDAIPMQNNNGVYEPAEPNEPAQSPGEEQMEGEPGQQMPNQQPMPPQNQQQMQQGQAMQPGQMQQGQMPQQMQQGQMPQQPTPSPEEQMASMVVENIEPPIDLYEPRHMESVDWFSNFLITDEGRKMDKNLRAVVHEMINTHLKCEFQRQQVMAMAQGAIQTAAGLPGQMVQNQQNQMDAQNQQQQALQTQALQQRGNLQNQMLQHHQNLQNSNLQHGQNLQNQQIQHQNNLQIERLRAQKRK